MVGTQANLSQESLERILSQLPFGLMVIDLKGSVLTHNAAAQALLAQRYGWTATEASGLQSLPWEIQTGVEYLVGAASRRAFPSPPPSLMLICDDLSLHLSLLFPDEGSGGKRSRKPSVVVVLKGNEPSGTPLWQSQSRLTDREREVLQWLAKGKTRKQMSTILGVSEATVRTHLENIYAKLGVTNRVEAAAAALWEQLAENLMSSLGLA